MPKIDDGGLVYPGKRMEVPEPFVDVHNTEPVEVTYSGITYRQWLAGLAMHDCPIIENYHEEIAEWCLERADAMIAKLKENIDK